MQLSVLLAVQLAMQLAVQLAARDLAEALLDRAQRDKRRRGRRVQLPTRALPLAVQQLAL